MLTLSLASAACSAFNGMQGFNDQQVAYVTRFLAVRLENMWSHHRSLKAKVYYNFSRAYSPDRTNVL